MLGRDPWEQLLGPPGGRVWGTGGQTPTPGCLARMPQPRKWPGTPCDPWGRGRGWTLTADLHGVLVGSAGSPLQGQAQQQQAEEPGPHRLHPTRCSSQRPRLGGCSLGAKVSAHEGVCAKRGASGNASHTLCVSEWMCVSVCTHACTRTWVCTGVRQVCMGLHACAHPVGLRCALLCWDGSEPGAAGVPDCVHSPSLPRGPQSLLCTVSVR